MTHQGQESTTVRTPGAVSEIPFTPQDATRFYLDLYKTTVDTQKHFNDIEWKIRGLALTVATFALGAAGVAVDKQVVIGPVSVATGVLLLGLLLWYAFYYVDRYWYHPMLSKAVEQGQVYEAELARYLPLANMTRLISEGSPQDANRFMRWASGVSKESDGKMHSEHKLKWFYRIGGTALATAAVGLQVGVCLT